MTDLIRVTVAPGQTVKLDPHPSGLAALPALRLVEGSRLRVSPAEADQLYLDGRILHPVTGRVRPAVQDAMADQVVLADGDGRLLTGPDYVVRAAIEAEIAVPPPDPYAPPPPAVSPRAFIGSERRAAAAAIEIEPAEPRGHPARARRTAPLQGVPPLDLGSVGRPFGADAAGEGDASTPPQQPS